jgi:antitoxin component YwqK of YwqJK toxin-antitoxin module
MLLKKILALKFIFIVTFVFSQNKNDTIDGALLTNFKKSDPTKVYRYQLSPAAYTFLKFKKGKVVQVAFTIANTSIDIDTIRNKDDITFKARINKTANGNVYIDKKGSLYLIVDFAHLLQEDDRNIYNHFTYYNNGNRARTYIVNDKKQPYCIEYYNTGVKFKEEIRDSTNKISEVKVYRKNSTLEYKSVTSEKCVVREFYSEKDDLTSIDSVDFNSKNIGSSVSYYPNKKIRGIIPYKDGWISGVCEEFYPLGQPKSKDRFKDGLPTGEFILYKKDGSIKKSKGNW